MKRTTLGELGNHLPIPLEGNKDTSFTFKSWGLKEEKEINEIKRRTQYTGPFIAEVLVKMLERCAGEDFTKMEPHTAIYEIYKMPFMDVIYLWIYLRYDQLDPHLRLNITCPRCNRMNENIIASMDGLDVDVIEEGDSPHGEYELKKQFKLEEDDADVIKVIKLKRTPWACMEKTDDEVTTNQGMIMDVMFRHSIIGWDEEEGYADFDKFNAKLRKIDFERLSNSIEVHNAGPTLAIEGKCKFCPSKFHQAMNWSYDSFFGSSSLPME